MLSAIETDFGADGQWAAAGRGTPVTVGDALRQVDVDTSRRLSRQHESVATGFSPLDEVLHGGLRPGDLMVVGGAAGVGKTIFGLQMARNFVARHAYTRAMYACYEHDTEHLLSRLLCLESAEMNYGEEALTLGRLAGFALPGTDGQGMVGRLRAHRTYGRLLDQVEAYAGRLFLVSASGSHSTVERMSEWAWSLADGGNPGLLVVDYLQKIPIDAGVVDVETETTAHLIQRLKELAMETGLRIACIVASDHLGLRRRRLRLTDLRGSSALQYEADVGLVLNNKFNIVSREHLIYNQAQAEMMRRWVVLSLEKNRSGRAGVDMEHALDAAHFRLVSKGGFVRDRLVDDRLTVE